MQLEKHIIIRINYYKGFSMIEERILNKKLQDLNDLKTKLVTRSDENKCEIVDKIKDTVDEIEMILEDFKYI